MLEKGASDLHLTSGLPPHIREHGEMAPLEGEAVLTPERMKELLFEVAPDLNRDEFTKDGDTDFAYEIPGVARFRANFFMDSSGPGAVFRVIPSKILTVQDLGLPASILSFCNLARGLVVVTGPTGSGKSTTLAAMIDHLNNTRRHHIVTIEDPIEFVHENKQCLFHQREVRRHTRDFKIALRASLRQDPNIILVGEMRDLETIEAALAAAETGCLVFGTLHTNTAASTVDRIIDQFPADRQPQIRTMLSSSLRGVVAQTLCKKIPKGRVAALEILVGNSAVGNCIREGKTYQIPSIMQVGTKLGMRSMNDSLFQLVKDGVVDGTEAYTKAVDKTGLMTKFTAAQIEVKLPTEEAAAK